MSNFIPRHIGPDAKEREAMLAKIGVASVDELINKTIPQHIRLATPLDIEAGMSENDYLEHVNELAQKNKVFKSFIGLGYNETIVPSVILRNVLENPGWYTAYTPYQAEISQGRLEALLNFQTMILDLTGMEIANASLLDEATAALDPETENLVLQSIRQNCAGGIIISHRIEPIKVCDEIVVFEKGRVVQRGTHPELINEQGSLYRKLFQLEVQ